MAGSTLKCPLCGKEFVEREMKCKERSAIVDFFKSLLGRKGKR